jgi:uncharacterized membrane protein YeaQ/YmgE (transglycosylase-associated protein family)
MEIIWYVIVGAIVGALGRLINPGPDPMGWIVTILIGIASLVLVGLLLPIDSTILRIIIGAIIAAVLVTVVQRFLPGADRRARA